jgi:ketosteroid isomerase-like protein
MSEESTTPDPMELARQIADTIDRRDWGALMSRYAPNAVFTSSGGGTFEGLADIREIYEDAWAPFEDAKSEVVESLYLGTDVGLSVVDMRLRPAGSSAEIQMRLATVWVLVEGLIEFLRDVPSADYRIRRGARRRSSSRLASWTTSRRQALTTWSRLLTRSNAEVSASLPLKPGPRPERERGHLLNHVSYHLNAVVSAEPCSLSRWTTSKRVC